MKHLSVLAIFFMSACSTTLTKRSDAAFVPEKRIFKKTKADEKNTATLVVVRDKGFVGSLFNHNLFLNGEKIACIAQGEKFEMNLEPKEYVLSLQANANGAVTYETEVILHDKETKVYRISIDTSSGLHLARTNDH